jgi:hypothetical protein
MVQAREGLLIRLIAAVVAVVSRLGFGVEEEKKSRWRASSSAPALVTSLFHLFDDFLNESRQVIRAAAGDDPVIGHNLLVNPSGAGVFYVLTYGLVRGHSAVLDRAGLD